MGFWIPSASRGPRKRYGGAIPWYRQCVLIRNIHDADQQAEGALKDQGPLASAPADPCTVTPPSPPMRPPMQPLPPPQQQRHAPPPIQVPPLLVHGGPILQQPPSSLPVSGAGGKRKEPEQPGASSSSSQCLALPGEPFGSPIRSNAPATHARLHGSDLEPISEENAPLAATAPLAAESHVAKRRALQPPSAGGEGYEGSAGFGPRPWWSKQAPLIETGTGAGAAWPPLLPPSSSASPGAPSSAGLLAVVTAPLPSPVHPRTSEGAAKAAAWQRRADLSVTAMRPLKATGLGTSFKR